MKLHICMLQSGTGAWGVYRAGDVRQRLIGKNNTFRTFREASAYARKVDRAFLAPIREQRAQQDWYPTTRRA